ncbi:uncharacterized protein K452DRAFT_18773 [Aplosporella prunicola CBS 121167]|uniref:Uncharacterized protein n=1 Tax=Aplosporella prunicola CBS 121167 TaxID=1176127 RepID=A0A6A6BE47_9PEZI|nr:uncharacterized protein K452DRAFT_18773 [Aplosporella prunicola CBS 121167]KAF2142442.1 hypothetical protein K452DRAFT_18773 [Aplosporella prunicola CBS 121167]
MQWDDDDDGDDNDDDARVCVMLLFRGDGIGEGVRPTYLPRLRDHSLQGLMSVGRHPPMRWNGLGAGDRLWDVSMHALYALHWAAQAHLHGSSGVYVCVHGVCCWDAVLSVAVRCDRGGWWCGYGDGNGRGKFLFSCVCYLRTIVRDARMPACLPCERGIVGSFGSLLRLGRFWRRHCSCC